MQGNGTFVVDGIFHLSKNICNNKHFEN